MLRMTNVLSIIALSTVLSGSLSATDKLPPEVEVTHWWSQPGEIQALNQIEDAVKSRGAKFVETRIPSWEALRSSILKRISMGYPPAVTQWLSNDYSFSFDQMGAIYSMPTKWRDQPIDEILFDEVYQGLATQDGLFGLPLGIHIQNNALFSKAIYDELKLPLPTSWREFLKQASLIEQAGYVPIALSNEMWQLHIVLNTILLGELGAEKYQKFYEKGHSAEGMKQSLINSFEILLLLKKYTDKGAKARNWSDSVKMIGQNKAAMHVLGDFAKGELIAEGYQAGKDFLCSLSPDSGGYMVYVIDSFLMFNMEEPHLKKGQEILFDTVLDPVVQARYNSKKGGIPIRKGVDTSQLDSCAQDTYRGWVDKDKKTISFTGMGNPLRGSFLQEALQKAWEHDDMSAEELVDEFITMDRASLQSEG